MSHKQKTDCTAGLRAFCDYGTHDSTAWTLQAGSLYDCICRSDIAVTLIEMTDELEDQRGGCRFLIPFYKGLLVWDKTAKLELIMSFVLSFNHGGQSRGRNVRLIHPFYSTVPARSCQKKKKKISWQALSVCACIWCCCILRPAADTKNITSSKISTHPNTIYPLCHSLNNPNNNNKPHISRLKPSYNTVQVEISTLPCSEETSCRQQCCQPAGRDSSVKTPSSRTAVAKSI